MTFCEDCGRSDKHGMHCPGEEIDRLCAEQEGLKNLYNAQVEKVDKLTAERDRYMIALERIIVENLPCSHGAGYTCFYCVAQRALGPEAYQKLKDETKDYAGFSKWFEKRGQRTSEGP